jgi:transforming growth factor-beta-induced protein
MNFRKNNPNKVDSPLVNRLSRILLLLLAVFVFAQCDNDDDDDNNMQSKSIVALAQENDDLSTLEAALIKYPDLVTTLGGSSKFTVFAPTNDAFADLLAAIGQTSLDDIPEDVLREVLEYHVVQGETLSSQLSNGEVETVGGEAIDVTVSGGVTLNSGSSVTTADVRASNGVVHVIDAVLVPPSIQPIVGTIVAPAYFNKNFTTLIAAVKAASPVVLETLLDGTPKTLFAPTNDAFTAAGITELPDQAILDAVLTYHVIGAAVMAEDIAVGSSSAETLNGDIYLSRGEGGVFINGSTEVVATDIEGSNGVVHVIDRTLMPPSMTIAAIVSDYAEAGDNAEFTQLLAALARTSGQGANDLLNAVSSPGNLTVFAPTDAAFQELYTALEVEGVDDIPLSTLIAVLKHHVVGARVFSSDLSSGAVATLNGNVTIDVGANPPTVTGGSGGENVADLQTTLLNIHATNGVIHVIDKVLVP